MQDDLLPDLVAIPAGEFLMGTPDGPDDEQPVHRVRLDGFEIGRHPVTHRQYARFVRETGHRPPAIYELPLVVSAGGEEREQAFRTNGRPYVWADLEPPAERLDHPVTLVRWEDAAAYCAWLTVASRREVRLPLEAEWEMAARGGLEGKRYAWGDRLEPGRGNFAGQGSGDANGTTACGTYPPNGYGLIDITGNVWEWVHDWYGAGYYASSPPRTPQGPPDGILRLVRGGSWLAAEPRMLTCGYRHKVPPDTYSYSIGFRVVVRPVRPE